MTYTIIVCSIETRNRIYHTNYEFYFDDPDKLTLTFLKQTIRERAEYKNIKDIVIENIIFLGKST